MVQLGWTRRAVTSIASVGRCHDLRNLTLTVLTDWQISEILHCRRWQMPKFSKFCIARFLQNRAIWRFSIAAFSQDEDYEKTTLLVSSFIFTKWDKSEKLHYKPTMPLFWNRQLCVKSTDFYMSKYRRKQCWFSECVRIVNTNNVVCLKVSDLPTPAMLFSWNVLFGEWS